MKRISDFLFVRHRHNWLLLIRFGLVGGSGVLVNVLVGIICNKVGPHNKAVMFPLGPTEYNIRWYHLYFLVSFLIANLWNFQLNRFWTFKSNKHASWASEYLPFLIVGAITMAIGQIIITGLMNPTSPIALSAELFDDSTGFRTMYYWAQLIAVLVTVPVSFVVNKLWTFRAVRGVKETFDEADADDDAESAGQLRAGSSTGAHATVRHGAETADDRAAGGRVGERAGDLSDGRY